MGNDLKNFLISFFADAYVLQDFIFKGALFHALIPSLMNDYTKYTIRLKHIALILW